VPSTRRTSSDQTTPTRARIIRAARELFSEQGYAATSVSQIARRAGVLTGSMYWAFDSKEQMFAAALEDAAEDWRMRLGSDSGVRPVRPGDVRRLLAHYAEAFATPPDFLRLLMIVATEGAAGTARNRAAAAAVREDWRLAFDEALRMTFAGRAPDRARAVTARLGRLLMTLLDGTHLALLVEPDAAQARALFLEAADVFERELAAALDAMGEPVASGG